MTLLEYAQYYVNKIGWSVIPIASRDKEALVFWKQYQQRKPTDEELGKWFHRQDWNLAVITGEVSGDLLVLDFDRIDLYLKWFNQHRLETLICRTGKGVHVYFTLLDGPVKNGKFYINGQHAGEIRYNGGYVLIPPSVHPNGSRYRWVWHTILSICVDQLHLRSGRRLLAPPAPMFGLVSLKILIVKYCPGESGTRDGMPRQPWSLNAAKSE